MLIHTHTDVDTSGVSYYGSTGLYLLHADGSCEVTVPLPKEGPISDAQWAPAAPAQFVVLAGRMPAAATLYNTKAEPIFEFGQAHRNTVSFSPHGRFLVLAGFGNLAGEMDFWDRNKQKLMGRNASHCAVGYGWSPCGRYFMTATLAPRMNVDNGVKVCWCGSTCCGCGCCCHGLVAPTAYATLTTALPVQRRGPGVRDQVRGRAPPLRRPIPPGGPGHLPRPPRHPAAQGGGCGGGRGRGGPADGDAQAPRCLPAAGIHGWVVVWWWGGWM